MSFQTWQETLIASSVDGATLTAAATASCIPPAALLTIPPNWWYVGRMMKITAQGRISCVVTTPGTARFLGRLGPTANISVFDTGALNLNIIAKTTVPWWLEILLTCRAVGSSTSANLFGMATFQSEAIIASAAPAAGGIASLLAPVGTPAVGTGFDSTVANILDLQFTQTVATGSLTCHMYKVESLN